MMNKAEYKAVHISMQFIAVVMYIIGVCIAMISNNWWVLLGAPLFILAVPDPYKYFGGKS